MTTMDRDRESFARSHKTTRRTILAALAASTVPVAAIPALAGPGDDDELIRPGAEFDRLIAPWPDFYNERDVAIMEELDELRYRGLTGALTEAQAEEVSRFLHAHPANDIIERVTRYEEQIDRICNRIREIVPSTAAGVVVIVRAARWSHCHWSFFEAYEDDDFLTQRTTDFLVSIEASASRWAR